MARAEPSQPPTVTPSTTGGAADPNDAWYATQADAGQAARTHGVRIEVDAMTTETQQVFADPDGTFTLEQRVRPVRVKRGDSWTPVDTTLVFTPDGRVEPKVTAVDLSFSAGGDTALAQLAQDGRRLNLGWETELPRPVLDGDTATYANVLPDVDLVVRADVEGFSEVLVIKTPEAAENPALATARFPISTDGLTLSADSAGNINARDSDARLVFSAPTPRMWDSSGDAEPGPAGRRTFDHNRGARQATMPVSIENGVLTVVPDHELLTDSQTRFPVYLDPSFATGSRLAWTSVWKKFPNTRYWNANDIARVGYSQQDNLVNRSFFRMNTNAVKGKNIIEATFQIWETYAWSCNAREVEVWRTGSISSSTTWDNQPPWMNKLATVDVAKGYNSSCPAGGVDFDVTAGVRTSAGVNAADLTLGLRATSETDTWAWKKFSNNPTLSIKYNSIPAVPASLSTSPGVPCGGGKVGNTDVVLRAVPTDADGGNVIAEFNFWPTSGATTARNVTVTSGNTASTTLLSTILTDGVTYNWRVRGKDSDDGISAWSPTCSFTVDQTLPEADVTVSSVQYPNYNVGGAVSTVPAGTPGQFTISADGDTDVVGFFVGIDDDSPSRYIPANAPGGTATVTLTPTRTGIGTVHVRTFDGVNPSQGIDTGYTFFATAPAGPHNGRGDVNADGKTDIIGRTPAGDLCLHLGNGSGGFLDGDQCSVKIDSNRQGWLHILRPGDWDSDGWNDLVVVEADGDLVYHAGRGPGSFEASGTEIITDWDPEGNPLPTTDWDQYNLVVAPGDWDGDGAPDLIARRTNGEIVLHRGNGYGGWADGSASVRLGWGIWQGFDTVTAPGDLDGDGKPDLLARKPTGELVLFRGNGKGGWYSPGGTKYTTWQSGLNVRQPNPTCDAFPSTTNCPTIIGNLNTTTQFTPICQLVGSGVGGNPYWVRIVTTTNLTGWIAGYYVNYTENQLPDVPNCIAETRTTYTVWVNNVNVSETSTGCEAAPSTTNCATPIDVLNNGDMFTPICQRTGQVVNNNPYWVYGVSSNGQTGWIANWWMDYPDNRLPHLAICGNYNGTQIGTGWQTYSGGLFAPGDLNGDGKADVLGIKANGDLHVYYGNHTGPSYFSNAGGGTVIDTGWNMFNKAF
ncbi:FG-GAP-like repeat-containing protein [Polymorphospora rubra]|uniref:FG-GAP-like repeat-containing protein n=1 Tax=Polymorphospora rubra TaxID=338584 RepID=UPI0033C7A41C